MAEIRMPSLGAEMEEGTVLEWYVKPGDRVEHGQLVALLDTEKAEIEMESFETGWIDALLVHTGETVPVGTPMATVRSEAQASEVAASDVSPTSKSHDERPLAPGERLRATPLARRIARERGIALESISGSGPNGAIVEADIMAAGAPEPADSSTATRPSKETSTASPSRRSGARSRRGFSFPHSS